MPNASTPESKPKTAAPRPTCGKCHLPIKGDEMSVIHGSAHFHTRCAPSPWIAGEKDDETKDPIAI